MRSDYKHQCQYMQETSDYDIVASSRPNETEAPGRRMERGLIILLSSICQSSAK